MGHTRLATAAACWIPERVHMHTYADEAAACSRFGTSRQRPLPTGAAHCGRLAVAAAGSFSASSIAGFKVAASCSWCIAKGAPGARYSNLPEHFQMCGTCAHRYTIWARGNVKRAQARALFAAVACGLRHCVLRDRQEGCCACLVVLSAPRLCFYYRIVMPKATRCRMHCDALLCDSWEVHFWIQCMNLA